MAQEGSGDQKIKLKGNISEVCQIWQLRRNFVILMILLSTNSFVYFLINFQMKYVKGSLIENTLASQGAEFTADVFSGVIYNFLGARKSFVTSYLFSIVGSLLLLFFIDDTNLIFIFIIIAKFGISAAFTISFIASIQLIPTIFAASVFGYCNIAARTVTIMSSMVAELEEPTPLIVSASAAFLAAVVSMFII